MVEQRVTDEQLAGWANWGPSPVPSSLFVAVIAELRAPRAREAELAAEFDQATRELADLAIERIALHQRIDKALELCDRGLLIHTRIIRAALTGTEPHRD